jgi:DNA-binding winged helix-turn-helix (wHTH) protein
MTKLSRDGLEFRIDLSSVRLFDYNNRHVHLSPMQWELLKLFCENSGKLLTKDDLINKIWKRRHVGDETIAHAVRLLRKALGDDANYPKFIETVRGHGFRFLGEVAEAPEAELLSGYDVNGQYPSSIDHGFWRESEKFLHVLQFAGTEVKEFARNYFAIILETSANNIVEVKITVADDFSCILDYDASYSSIRLAGGPYVLMTREKFLSAIAEAMPLKEKFDIAAIGFCENDSTENFDNIPIENCRVNVAVVKKLSQLNADDLPKVIQQLLWNDDCRQSSV